MPSFHAFFRELFQTFLADFLRLAEPDYIPHLLLEQIRYPVLDLTGWTDDQRASLGVVADVPARDGTSVTILIHTEPAPLDPLGTAQLLAKPFLHLEAAYSQPVLLTTVYLHGGRPGVNLESAAIRQVFGMELVRILYTTFGLSESRAEHYRYPVLDLTGWTDDQRASLGVVADVPARDGTSVTILIHTEPAPLDPLGTAQLLAKPFLHLEAAYSQPVLLTTVYLHGGRPGVNLESAAIRQVFGMELVRILYTTFGLSESRAEHYLERPEPLAWALAALMRPTQRSRAEHRKTCLDRIRGAGLPARETGLLTACVEEWMDLRPEERSECVALAARDRSAAAAFP